MKKVLILGGTGFLGSHLARGLADSFDVTITARNFSKLDRVRDLAGAVGIVEVEKQDMHSIFQEHQFNFVINAAVHYGHEEFSSSIVESNIALPLRALEAAIEHKSSLFITTDSFFARLPQSYPYLKEYRLSKKHLKEWCLLLAKHIPTVVMQLEHVYGIDDSSHKFLPMMVQKLCAQEERVELTPGFQQRDFVNVLDVVEAFKVVLSQAHTFLPQLQTIEVGTGTSTSVRATLEMIKSLAGSSTELAFGALPYREEELMESTADVAALRGLGWKPSIELKQGLKQMIAAAKEMVAA